MQDLINNRLLTTSVQNLVAQEVEARRKYKFPTFTPTAIRMFEETIDRELVEVKGYLTRVCRKDGRPLWGKDAYLLDKMNEID